MSFSLIVSGCASTHKTPDVSSADMAWVQYAHSDFASAGRYLDPRFEAFFLSTLPPGSDLVRSTKVLGFREVGNDSVIVDLDSDGFKHWVALKKMEGSWKLTLDENEVLEVLTKDWHKQQFGNIQFVTKTNMTGDQVKLAKRFAAFAEEVENTFDVHIPLVNYYVASSPEEAYLIVGQGVMNAGRGRLRAVKTYDRYDHLHEFVHVVAMEIGLINPYFDEGLATAFEGGFRFKSKADCKSAFAQLKFVFPQALSGDAFNALDNREHVNVYGIAQATMRYWLESAGLERVKNVLRETVQSPKDFQLILERELGTLDAAMIGTKSQLHKACDALQ